MHLVLVQDLSTMTFIRSFKRFCARRGVQARMLLDNPKTFQAADRIIKAILHDPAVQQHFAGLRVVEWHFNLEKAPWQGGIFERLLKSAKRCLRKEDLTRRMGHLVETCAKFWRRWKREYLQELREHHRSSKIPPGVGRLR